MSPVGVAELAIGVGLAGCIPAYWFAAIGREARRERAARKQHVRARRAYYAAIEAGEDDPAFSPVAITQSILQIVAIADRIWRARTLITLDNRPDGELIRRWARARQSWLGSGIRVSGNPSVELLSVVNRADESEARVAARVRVRIHCRRSRLDLFAVRHVRLDERWTLGRSDGRWALLSTDGDPLAGPVLSAPLIPTPAYDTERLREESFAELATAQKVPDAVALSDLVGADVPPSFALLDLSVVDGRFLPELVASQLTHLVQAWEEAVTGSEAPLEPLASAGARAVLLRPSPGKRLLIRDAVLKSWEPTSLELSHVPPRIVVKVDVEAVRYAVTDDGTHRAGNDNEPRPMTLTWTMELTDSTRTPWRLIATTNPAEGIPGWSLF